MTNIIKLADFQQKQLSFKDYKRINLEIHRKNLNDSIDNFLRTLPALDYISWTMSPDDDNDIELTDCKEKNKFNTKILREVEELLLKIKL